MIIELLLPYRNFVGTLVYLQYLRLAYHTSPPCKHAFNQLDSYCLHVTKHPKCPSLVASLYGRVRQAAAYMTKLPEPKAN